MAILHRATLTPTKLELIGAWAPTQPWGPAADEPLELIGAFRFDDPDGRVGIETHLVAAGDAVLHVPLTYRDTALDGADDGLAGTMEHSALGTRWVYDGLRDPQYVAMLAGVALTGQGEALGVVGREDRWYAVPTAVRISGGGWTGGPVPIDGFELVRDDESGTVLRNDRFELTVFRRPTAGPRPAIGLTATWAGLTEPVILATITER